MDLRVFLGLVICLCMSVRPQAIAQPVPPPPVKLVPVTYTLLNLDAYPHLEFFCLSPNFEEVRITSGTGNSSPLPQVLYARKAGATAPGSAYVPAEFASVSYLPAKLTEIRADLDVISIHIDVEIERVERGKIGLRSVRTVYTRADGSTTDNLAEITGK